MQYTTTEFETLYKRCFSPAMRLALSLLRDEDDARDVIHEVFIRLWESEVTIENPSAFIIRSVRNACLNRIKMLDTREKIKLRLTLELQPDEYDVEQRDEEVISAINQLLTPREQQVVDKIYREGASYKETASSLGVSIAAVNKHIVTSLKKLRTHFKSEKS